MENSRKLDKLTPDQKVILEKIMKYLKDKTFTYYEISNLIFVLKSQIEERLIFKG